MNTFWVHKNWKWKKENATAKYIDAQCEEAVTLADAQATIAALEETILKMGENAAVVAKDAMAAKEQIAALQAERDEYKTMYACLTGETYDNPIADLQSQLTQRTAELERVRGERDLWKSRHDAELQGEVELIGKVNGLKDELDNLHTLILALPKVEGEIEVSSGVYNFILLKRDTVVKFLCGQIETEQTAQAIAALWEHRQGMEG